MRMRGALKGVESTVGAVAALGIAQFFISWQPELGRSVAAFGDFGNFIYLILLLIAVVVCSGWMLLTLRQPVSEPAAWCGAVGVVLLTLFAAYRYAYLTMDFEDPRRKQLVEYGRWALFIPAGALCIYYFAAVLRQPENQSWQF